MISMVYRSALILHQIPKDVLILTVDEIQRIWKEYVDMTNEVNTGKKTPRVYEYERNAIADMRERFDGRD